MDKQGANETAGNDVEEIDNEPIDLPCEVTILD